MKIVYEPGDEVVYVPTGRRFVVKQVGKHESLLSTCGVLMRQVDVRPALKVLVLTSPEGKTISVVVAGDCSAETARDVARYFRASHEVLDADYLRDDIRAASGQLSTSA